MGNCMLASQYGWHGLFPWQWERLMDTTQVRCCIQLLTYSYIIILTATVKLGWSVFMLCWCSFCAGQLSCDQKSGRARNLIQRVVGSSSWHVTCLEPLLNCQCCFKFQDCGSQTLERNVHLKFRSNYNWDLQKSKKKCHQKCISLPCYLFDMPPLCTSFCISNFLVQTMSLYGESVP